MKNFKNQKRKISWIFLLRKIKYSEILKKTFWGNLRGIFLKNKRKILSKKNWKKWKKRSSKIRSIWCTLSRRRSSSKTTIKDSRITWGSFRGDSRNKRKLKGTSRDTTRFKGIEAKRFHFKTNHTILILFSKYLDHSIKRITNS
jgi:hypothetical protein